MRFCPARHSRQAVEVDRRGSGVEDIGTETETPEAGPWPPPSSTPAPASWSSEGVWWQDGAIASIRAVEAQPSKVTSDTTAFIVFTNLPGYQMPLEDYYVRLEQAFTGFRKPDFATEKTLLGDRYQEIANLFDAFNMHDVVSDTF